MYEFHFRIAFNKWSYQAEAKQTNKNPKKTKTKKAFFFFALSYRVKETKRYEMK
jgi:hypothetical protein